MRVELLVTLKGNGKKLFYKGIYNEPLPASIRNEVMLCRNNPRRGTVRVLEDVPTQQPQSVETKTAKVIEVEKTEAVTSPIVTKKRTPIKRVAKK
jgi:hypothetical protein